MDKTQHKCNECGMALSRANEYHPFSACLMYKQVRDAEVVRVNLRAVVEYGRDTIKNHLGPEFVDMVRTKFKGCSAVVVAIFLKSGEITIRDANGKLTYVKWDRSKGETINTAIATLEAQQNEASN